MNARIVDRRASAVWRQECRLVAVAVAVLGCLWWGPASAQESSSPATLPAGNLASAKSTPPTFIANNTSLSDVFDAIEGRIERPIVASPKTRALFVTGTFDLASPTATLDKLVQMMGLMTYDDGRSIYIYRNNEVTGSMVRMGRQRLGDVRAFLRSSNLYDERYPIAGSDGMGVFYVSGPPIYVHLVVAAAKYLDELPGAQSDTAMVLRVVPLHNTFVANRRYRVRGELVTVPGVADVIHALFATSGGTAAGGESSAAEVSHAEARKPTDVLALPLPKPADDAGSASDQGGPGTGKTVAMREDTVWDVRMVSNPDGNSILLYGPRDHVDLMERSIRAVDVAKRQIELSLWIIDVDRQKLNELGINWQSSSNFGPLTASVNGTQMAALNGITFLATINALSEKGRATIVSRPIVLTEENVPAIFDNSHTQYYPLVGERTTALEHFTYGTLVSVLPRLTREAKEVEMIVTVQDGRSQNSGSTAKDTPVIPGVSSTQISTVARVPRFKSLLLGGSTIDQHETTTYYIPGLWKLPVVGSLFRLDRTRTEHMVRLFLIQPRVLARQDGWQDGQTLTEGGLSSSRSEMAATSRMLQRYMDNVDDARADSLEGNPSEKHHATNQ